MIMKYFDNEIVAVGESRTPAIYRIQQNTQTG